MREKRKALSKKMRFEVFKRDRFTCQYCGRMAPDVILEVDHIEPVAEGGTDEFLNLITSCRDCNRGKGKTRITDDTVAKKQQAQLQELAEKKEQIEMLLTWKSELAELANEQAVAFGDYIGRISHLMPNDRGLRDLVKWINEFGAPEVLEAIDISYSHYYDGDSDESWEKAFSKIGGICYNTRKQRETRQ